MTLRFDFQFHCVPQCLKSLLQIVKLSNQQKKIWMNNYSNYDSKKNSVNSSLATVKLPQRREEADNTINKQKQKNRVRFSYQEAIDPQQNYQKNSSYKERNSSYKEKSQNFQLKNLSIFFCINHQQKTATHVALESSENPMYYCERCSILIASKGFSINRISNDLNKQNVPLKRNSLHHEVNVSENKKFSSQIPHQNIKNDQLYLTNKYLSKSDRIFISNQIVSELQSIWKKLKQKRVQSLSGIDVCMNAFNQTIDQLQDYFYTIHQYVQKQKNMQIKQILRKKQSLEQLRYETNNTFIAQFMKIKNLKDFLIQNKFCDLSTFTKTIDSSYNLEANLFINSQLILQEFYSKHSFSNGKAHQVGEKIALIINSSDVFKSGFNCFPNSQTKEGKYQDQSGPIPLSVIKKQDQSNKKRLSFNNIHLKPYTRNSIKQNVDQNYQNRPSVQQKEYQKEKNLQSSVRSLQLSFASSQNEENIPGKKQETNNYTLNQYINKGQQSSSYITNLLMTSTQI